MTVRVLLPVEILAGESISPGVIDLLSSVDVVLLGYHELPDQTPPDQARLQFEERAMSALENIAEGFSSPVEIRLVFTHDRDKTFRRIATEYDVDAYLIPGAAGSINNLLVSLSGKISVEAILDFVEALIDGRSIAVTLHLVSDDLDAAEVVSDAASHLRQHEISTTSDIVSRESPFTALLEAVSGHDAIIVGEEGQTLTSLVFGDTYERIAAESVSPVIVVRK